MFRKLLSGLAAWLLAVSPVNAQMMGVAGGPFATSGTYTGPGDVTGWTFWTGLRAFSAAVAAAGTQPLINLRRTSDAHTCDVIVASNGGFGLTGNCSNSGDNGEAPSTWASRSTFSGTITSTTLATTGDNCTTQAGDQIIGAGINGVTTVSSISSCAATVGSYQISAAQTVSVSETISSLVPTFVPERYDQTGGGRPLLQSTTTEQPQLYFNCLALFPCVSVPGGAFINAAANFTPGTGAASLSLVANRAAGSGATIFAENGTSGNRIRYTAGTANQWGVSGTGGGGVVLQTASDTVWHAAQGVMNGGSTVLNIDGAEATGSATNTTTSATPIESGGASTTSYDEEFGFADQITWSSTVRTKVCENEQTFYGATNFGATC